jgi:hypothetical protein
LDIPKESEVEKQRGKGERIIVKKAFALKTWIMAAVILLFFFCQEVWADQEVFLEVYQGTVRQSVYVQAIPGSITYLPVRQAAELIGVPLKWDRDMGSVICHTYGQTTVITPGLNKVYTVNGAVTTYTVPAEPVLNQGRVYIPMRILELLGVGVGYDAKHDRRSLHIPAHLNQFLAPPAPEKINLIRDLIIKEKDKIPKKIGSFSTYFNVAEKSRTKNLKLAAEAINNCLIKSGNIFSFNQTVGPRIPEKGFEKAIVYINKEKVEDYGGGICQVSTTLYNAVLQAGLPVLERHPHSLPVPYVPAGQDATVSFGTLDLKFKNDRERDILIKAVVDKNKLTVELYALPMLAG